MTDALFSTLELSTPGDVKTGYRLQRIEIYNWGTFDGRIWSIRPAGDTSLLTGDIGSGKSTIVDAITTLLLPANRIAYNKAAGADSRERTLRSYVEGHYKSERNEATGASRPVGLRNERTYSVILGVFGNDGFDETVSIAQVFHQKDRTGQPDRFFVTASRGLTIEEDFSGFGSDLKSLRAQLRARGAEIDNAFPEYGRRVRRLLGIRSDQAMELFHQTVSMKSVGNLNDFVRGHMLEPLDAETKVSAIVDHFENLTKAHEAVRTATDQIALLDPLIAAADRYDGASDRHRAHIAERDAVAPYVSELTLDVLATAVSSREAERVVHDAIRSELETARRAVGGERERLVAERAVLGGDRLHSLDADIPSAQRLVEERGDRRQRHATRLEDAGLGPVNGAEEFRARQQEAAVLVARHAADSKDLNGRQIPLLERRAELRVALTALREEIASLESRRNNLPADRVRVREALCAALDVDETDVPFAGELLDVRGDSAEWRGAAERVLRGFALTMLVPQRAYAGVSEWINAHHLNAQVVYLRVAERRVRTVAAASGPGRRLFDVLEVEPGEYADFLWAELASRAEHLLVDSVVELQRADRAVTREGLTRDRDRHEKDDRRRADDPRSWVLGRGSEQKIAALREEEATAESERQGIEQRLAELDDEREAFSRRSTALAALAEYRTWADLDVEGARASLGALVAERERLTAGSTQLAEIELRLARLAEDDERITGELTEAAQRIGGIENELRSLQARRHREEQTKSALTSETLVEARSRYPAIATRVGRAAPTTVEDCDALGTRLTAALTAAVESAQREMNGYTTSIQQQMNEVLRRWPVLRAEMDASVGSLAEFRALHERVRRDDLPRFEEEFKHQLDSNAVRELAAFHTWLRRQSESIHERVDRINEALGDMDYNPGRRIVLIAEPTVNQEIRQFRGDLREATTNLLETGAADSERKFEQVRVIIERLRGRESHTESDRAWTRRVTDVRNWFTFAASEQDRETREEFEHYTDSDGKSGGQKEKLAYTILAASLAYQFGLEWGVRRSRDFRFAVIDEAFGRGSDASTRYALELFGRLGLQLLIVTPLQKVHVIEPFVDAIGFVDNPTGASSRVHTLTIEEFRERQRVSRG